MKDLFREVLELQLDFSSENTASMARRGDLIRNIIPGEMRDWKAGQADAVLPFRGRLNVQGRDGTGRKTLVPWVRIHSPELSPSAQKGWYAVYLFHEHGDGLSLCLSHGSTSFNGRDFVPRSAAEVAELMAWSRGLLTADAQALGFAPGVDLGSTAKLSQAYERTAAFSKTYGVNDLPDDEELMLDAAHAVSLLGRLYQAIELGRTPEAEPLEVQQARMAIEAIAKPNKPLPGTPGQGFGLTAPERKTVEDHAMGIAKAWLVAHGYENIQDVSGSQSCDFWAKKAGVDHYVEVKGTTGGFGTVLLTANEVDLHRDLHPDNILIVVHNIDLVDRRSRAIGGQVVVLEAWDITTAELRPLSFSCRLAVP